MDVGQTGHRRVPPCWATVHSGQPPNQMLFNGTVCRGGSSFFGQHQGAAPPRLTLRRLSTYVDTISVIPRGVHRSVAEAAGDLTKHREK